MDEGSRDHCASSETDPNACELLKRSAIELYSRKGLLKKILDLRYCCKII